MPRAGLTAPAGAALAEAAAAEDGRVAGEHIAAAGSPQPHLRDALERASSAFGFFQAVRALEQLLPEREPVGGFGEPAREVARFRALASLAFPAAEVAGLTVRDDAPAEVDVSFLGLTGPAGVLPLPYTQVLVDRLAARDPGLRDFLDLFHHRATSLFYRAWCRSRPDVAYGRGAGDWLTAHLRDLIGLGTPGLAERLPLGDDAVLRYAGLFALRPRPALALRGLLSDYFEVPVEIVEFVGAWCRVEPGAQCEVGADDDSTELGVGTLAGDEVWDAQARARVRLGPLSRARYDEFLPTGASYGPLRALAQLFAGGEVDLELQLVLARDEVPFCALGLDDVPLGWCTWLRGAPLGRDPDDTLLAL